MLDNCHSILDLRQLAQRRVPAPIFDVLDGAAESEVTARRNTNAFDEVNVAPRCLVDVGNVSTSARILGQAVDWPVLCSPVGCVRFFHPDGELAVARAAMGAGTLYALSTAASYSLEEVAKASDGPKLFQLFMCKDRELTRTLIERAKRAGYKALCITVNVPVGGNCERDLRTRLFDSPVRWPLTTARGFLRHPWWLLRWMRMGSRVLANFAGPGGAAEELELLAQQLDPSTTWKEVRDVAEIWGGPCALKGVMSGDMARRAADAGFSAVIVSNHGGRQLDGAIAAIEALPEIVEAVGDRLEVILDGGIRRGVHVLKALALGAKACSIGRPYLYGLCAGGQMGVAKALSILRTELIRAMQLAGCPDLASIDAGLIRKNLGNFRYS